MKINKLGKTDLMVSQLGIGFARSGYAMDSLNKVRKLIHTGLDAGINFIDTAECYGNSEEILGQIIPTVRNKLIIATKVGHLADDFKGIQWTYQAIDQSINNSLKKLNIDFIDIIHLHANEIPFPPPDGVLEALVNAKITGKCRFIGLSHENQSAISGISTNIFDTLQTSFNLIDQKARYKLLPLCKEMNVGVIAKRPIAKAIWKNIIQNPNDIPLGFANVERYRRAKLILESDLIESARQNPIALSLGFTLAHDIDTAIVGTRNVEHLIQNVESVNNELPISEISLKYLRDRFDSYGANWNTMD